MALAKDDWFILVALVIAAWLFIGCVTVGPNVSASPTPSPTPALTPTPTPAPTPTPTPSRQCPASCDDGNPCTSDDCGARTGFVCESLPLSGPQTGCSGDTGNCTERTCASGACVSGQKTPCCGNGECEAGEGCGTCPIDCACGSGLSCCGNECAAPACTGDAQCADNDTCTRDACTGAGTCTASCQHLPKPCFHGDRCCPAGCDYMTDNDCPAYSKGQPARTRSGLSISVDALYRRDCMSSSGREVAWLALRLTLSYGGSGSVAFNPANVTIVDQAAGRTFTPSTPVGTDCYTRDADFILRAGDIHPGEERIGLIYYDPGDLTIRQTSKRVIVDMGGGERLIWLVSPG